jgi:hypothetical protein
MFSTLEASRFRRLLAEEFRLLSAIGLTAWMVCAGQSTIVCAQEPTRVFMVSPRDKATEVSVQALVQIQFSSGL